MAIRNPLKQTTKYARRETPKRGASRDERDVIENGDSQPASDADKRLLVRATLTNLTMDRIRESVHARQESGIEEEWQEATDLYNGVDDLNATSSKIHVRDKNPAPTRGQGARSGGQSSLYVNILKPKTKVIRSRVKEMLVPNDQKPWSVAPTPVPELDEVTKDPKLAGSMVQLGDGTMAPALAVAERMMDLAKKASKNEADWIEDRFVEGKVYGHIRKVIDDAAMIGTGVLMGPVPVSRTTRRWIQEGGSTSLKLASKEEPTSLAVPASDCFPDPACGDNIHNGSYFNYRKFATEREVRRLAETSGYDRAAIADAILEGPISFAMLAAGGIRPRMMAGDTRRVTSLYELWFSYGDCTPEALIAMGVKDPLLGNMSDDGDGDRDTVEMAGDFVQDPQPGGNVSSRKPLVNGAMPGDQARAGVGGDTELEGDDDARLSSQQEAALASIPAIVTMLNGRPIRAVIAPQESGEFPFDFFPFEPKEGQPWGTGVPMQGRAAQLIVKSGIRRLMENGGLAAGPQIAYTDGVLEPQNGVYEITGRKLWKFIPNDLVKDIRAAMAFFTVPSVQKELMEIIQLGMTLLDQLTNAPLLLHGDDQPGSAPETLGGRKLFQNNAMSPLRDIAKGYDDDLMIPHLGRYHAWWMEHVPGSDKGDSEVKALGSTALIAREEGREFLMQLAAVKDDPAYRINPSKWTAELARANGYDMSLIQYTEDEWKAEQAKKAQVPPPEAPQVTAAKIRVEGDAKTIAAEGQLQREQIASKERIAMHDAETKTALAEVEKEIAEMQLAGKENISLIDVKAMLASKSADIESRRQEMQLKMAPQNPSHLGI